MDFFDNVYRGTPPWDIGRPQKAFVDLVRQGEITGSVLDIGCGTGEHALFFAEKGFEAWGIDAAPLAIRKAQEKAEARELDAHFLVLDALDLARLGRKFDTVTDSGLFHTLSDENRPVFENSLSAVLPHGGNYFMLCFSDKEPGGYDMPRRIPEQVIRDTFRDGWTIRYIRPTVFESSIGTGGHQAWISSIEKK